MIEIKDKPIQLFLDELASKSPTPGGGSAAAVMGAQAAALISMVCNLTIGKPQYSDVEEEMRGLLEKSEALRETFTEMVKADVDAFNRVMACYGLPKGTEEEKSLRSESIQMALKQAADVPMHCVRACSEVIGLSREAAEKGNVNVVSDAGVATMAGYAALKSAALNVYINIGNIRDTQFADDMRIELESILWRAEREVVEIYQMVQEKL
ncbi:MAG: methenyltetrahydrofolate cyclohydrolase [Gammaproteobacteria bacterium]